MSWTGFGEVADLAKSIVGAIVPDKTQVEKDATQLAVANIIAQSQKDNAQTDIDKVEAASSDPLQHWRGALGWVCVLGYWYTFLVQPVAVGSGWNLPKIDIGPLATLTLGMLGLGGLHVAERIKGVS